MKRFTLSWAIVLAVTSCTTGTSPSDSPDSLPPSTQSNTSSASPPGSTVAPNGRPLETVDCADAPDDVSIVCEVYDLIRRNYVDEISDSALALAAQDGVDALDGSESSEPLVCPLPASTFVRACAALSDEAEDSVQGAEAMVVGMISALDPNSVYLDRDSVELIEEEQEGQIEGIGALVTAEDSAITEGNRQCSLITTTCQLIIVSTIAGSPAEEAGVQREDIVVGVDGKNITGWTLDEVTATVRGPAGSDVVLTVARGNRTVDIAITRAAVVIPVVDSANYDGIGYVKLNLFTENADEQLEAALLGLLEDGIDELVFDLSDNPGGLLDTSIEIASLFLGEGDIVVTEGPNNDETFDVTGNQIVPDDLPVTIIVNRGSASASEVVSAVLQERGRGTVVGENSFGKNTVQQRFSLSNGGAFKITIARWLTPGGLDFGGTGVKPNIPHEFEPDLDTEAMARVAASLN